MSAVTLLLTIGFAALAGAAAHKGLRGTSRADRLNGNGAANTIKGGQGNDRISGRGGNDVLLGGPGNDRLSGGPGRDRLAGGGGKDLVLARDGERDRVDCGAGKDRAVVDALDKPVRGCERVDRPAAVGQLSPPAPAAPPAPPASPVITPVADLGVSAKAPGSASVGENVTYTIAVHDAGPSPAAEATLSVALPAGLTLVSATAPGVTCDGAVTITCNLGTVGADVTLTVVATAGDAAVAGADVVATVSSPTPDPNAADNQSTASTAVHVPLDLSKESTLIAVGDIAGCEPDNLAGLTATLVDGLPGPIALLGDAVYEVGSPAEYADCFDPAWGALRWRTFPVPGDHDYKTPDGTGYFGYWGARAGELYRGWYSYDIGSWHVVALNGNCGAVLGCEAGSPQEQWLRADLAAHPAQCTLAYWHQPYLSSGDHQGDAAYGALWQALYDAGAEIVLNGHDHDYERFAPQDPTGAVDEDKGIREFVVGTGGRYLRQFGNVDPTSEARDDQSFGALELKLGAGTYEWDFRPAGTGTFTDPGRGTCH